MHPLCLATPSIDVTTRREKFPLCALSRLRQLYLWCSLLAVLIAACVGCVHDNGCAAWQVKNFQCRAFQHKVFVFSNEEWAVLKEANWPNFGLPQGVGSTLDVPDRRALQRGLLLARGLFHLAPQ